MTFRVSRHLALCLAACLGLSLAMGAPPAQAAPSEVQITPYPVIDFEFDQDRQRFVFTDSRGDLWVSFVDPATGDFKAADGKQVLIDRNVALATDFGNGPEWLFGPTGGQIVYTKYLSGKPKTPENARVAVASVANGAWQTRFLDTNVASNFPMGSLKTGDRSPRVSYERPPEPGKASPGFYWRTTDAAGAEELVPNSFSSLFSRRWVPGTHSIAFTNTNPTPDGGSETQAFLYDTDTRTLEQLTTDSRPKWQVFMWQAPEFGNETIFFALCDRNEIRFYRKLDRGDGQLRWTAFKSVFAPPTAPYIWSPEPFVHNGHSYISMVASPSEAILDFNVPTHIMLASLQWDSIRYMTAPDGPPRVRFDPEVFFTDLGPRIYYNNYIPGSVSQPARQNGVWRIDPDLSAMIPTSE